MTLLNLFADLTTSSPGESFTELLTCPGLKIERIVSTGQTSPPDFWYDQPHGEWVAVLAGAARLRFENKATLLHLQAGDFVHIPPHRRHRIEWTDTSQATIWLAIHYAHTVPE